MPEEQPEAPQETVTPDNQAPTKEKWHAPLTRVTPLSKYLALALFVVLPFVGFWMGVGYMQSVSSMCGPDNYVCPAYPKYIEEQEDSPSTVSATSTRILLDESPYATDGVTVWYNDCIIEGADLGSFSVLSFQFARDDYRVWNECSLFDDVDNPFTFRIVTNYLVADLKRVWFKNPSLDSNAWELVSDAAGETFKVLNQSRYYIREAEDDAHTAERFHFAVDRTHVWHLFFGGMVLVSDADPVTFHMVEDFESVYYSQNPNRSGFVADNTHVWGYENTSPQLTLLEQVNPLDFKVVCGYGTDGVRVWEGGGQIAERKLLPGQDVGYLCKG